MIKRSIIFILLINITQYDSIIKSNKDRELLNKIKMENRDEKILIIKKKLVIGKKYNIFEGKLFLKYIIIGEWIIPPNENIKFFNDNKFKKQDMTTNYFEEGYWKLENNNLVLIRNNKKISYQIDYFILEKSDFSSSKYSFTIVFKNNTEMPILVFLFD